MNERIRELIEQCTDRHFSEGGGFETFDKEKFAELIVRECAEFCERTDSYLFAKMLKEHFGVE
jgi:hypothetical protein